MVQRIVFINFFLFVFLFVSACGGSTAMRSNKPAESVEAPPLQHKSLVAGSNHFFALQDGELTGWGNNFGGKATAPEESGIRMVSAGLNHSLALTEDGRVLAFGGESHLNYLHVPEDLEDVRQVVAGQDTSIAVLEDGSLVMWGYDDRTPSLGENVAEVEAGYDHYLAKLKDGRILAWGDNYHGQVRLPNGITDEHGVVEIAAGRDHNVVLRSDGRVFAWGDNTYGQCDVPEFDQPVVDIEANTYRSLALLADGTLVSWGTPLPQSAPQDIVEMEANYTQILLRTADGAVHHIAGDGQLNLAALDGADAASGGLVLNSSGEVLPIFRDTSDIPADLPSNIVKIKGRYFPFSKKIYYRSVPVPNSGSGVLTLPRADGDYRDHPALYVGLALSAAGELFLWGDNYFSQLDVPALGQPVIDADCGAWHCLALLENGEILAWGDDRPELMDVPDDLDGVVAVRAGASFNLALIEDGSVVVWGNNDYQELELPEFSERVIDIFADGYSGGVILADGSSIVWRGETSILLDGDTIGAGGLQTLVFGPSRMLTLNAEGEVASWSENGYEHSLANAEAVTHLSGFNGVYTQVDQGGGVSMWGAYRIPSNLAEVLEP